MKLILRVIAILGLGFAYSLSWLVSITLGVFRSSHNVDSPRLLVIGTFHNPNWFFAHITPLTRCGIKEVILVCDEPVASLENLTYACPPRWLARSAGRAGAKFIWSLRCAFHYRPDLYMGYHIFPAAISALMVARITGKPAIYQCTAGPLELEGGGWHAENKLLIALGKPSLVVEKLVHAVVRQFDLVVVRGSRAQQYIEGIGYRNDIAIITGSVATPHDRLQYDDRCFDAIFVGRLTEYKRPDYFVEVIGRVAQKLPAIRVIMVGDGPDRDQLRQQIERMGLADNIELLGQRDDVPSLLSQSRVFVLTSRWEGLSIAMIEAMTHGVVPVVSDVGDLRDLARQNETGFVEPVGAVADFSTHVLQLLSNSAQWEKMSVLAAESAIAYSSVEAISGKWRYSLGRLTRQV